jgi:hypothetical protein
MMSAPVGRGSSGFKDMPVLGAVKIVRPVGRCILTAPALRRDGLVREKPRDPSAGQSRVICTSTPRHDLDKFIRSTHPRLSESWAALRHLAPCQLSTRTRTLDDR